MQGVSVPHKRRCEASPLVAVDQLRCRLHTRRNRTPIAPSHTAFQGSSTLTVGGVGGVAESSFFCTLQASWLCSA